MAKNKKIKIPFTDEDLQDLEAGEVFNWTFDGVDVELFKGCMECEKPEEKCKCNN